MTAFAGAIIAGKMRYIKKKLVKKGAVAAESAVKPEEADLASSNDRILLSQMVKAKKVGKTEDGKVWWKG